MNADVIMVLVSVLVLTINCTTMILIFPSKLGLPLTIGALTLFTAIFYAVLYFSGIIVPDDGGLPGLAYLPIMILLFDGKFFQKVFAYFIQFLLTTFQITLAKTVGGAFIQYGENVSFAVFLALLLLMFTIYVTLVFKFGRRFFERLFEYGRASEWVFYSFGAVFSFVVLTTSQMAPGNVWQIVLLLLFILWSFAVLCFAIINTNEKSRLRYEAEFARDVISTGREHYQKMNEMYNVLRVMRHDYKYHLDTISELLNSDNESEAEKYLADIQKQLSDSRLPNYCSNSAINALLTSYSERCAKLNISVDIDISMPETIAIPNYEMCIVLGNLLENAIEAYTRHDCSGRIELIINTQGTHLAVMVKNSLSGDTAGDKDMNTKKDSGLGLRSVQAVAARYGGELMTEWDGATFAAYVLMRL